MLLLACLLISACGSATTRSQPTGPGDDDDSNTVDDDDSGTPADDDDSATPSDDDDASPDWPDPVIQCAAADASMGFSPSEPETGETLDVWVTADTGYVWIGMAVSGPGAWSELSSDITGAGPFTWSYQYTLDHEGWYRFAFSADTGSTPICEGEVFVHGESGGDDDDTGPGDDDDATASTGPPPDNPFGIGLVDPGSPAKWDLSRELSGPGGHIKVVFPGVQPGMTAAPPTWSDAVQEIYDRDLVPVIRLGPPWGDRNIREDSDDPAHRSYTSLAASYAAVVADLPLRDDWPLWIEVHNEPNLCYEWECDASVGWLDSNTRAAEYAAFLRDVNAALQALGEPRIRVINGGLAPGGAVSCECGTANFSPGETSLDFIAAMRAEVPGIFASLDGFSSHPYPASGAGYGFFDSYTNSAVGLAWWSQEIAAAGVSSHPVLITETGWTVGAGAFGSRQDVADWTLSAWQNDWFPNAQLEAVMPFQLQDAVWDEFSWVDTSGTHYPVFDRIRDWRCSMAFPEPC